MRREKQFSTGQKTGEVRGSSSPRGSTSTADNKTLTDAATTAKRDPAAVTSKKEAQQDFEKTKAQDDDETLSDHGLPVDLLDPSSDLSSATKKPTAEASPAPSSQQQQEHQPQEHQSPSLSANSAATSNFRRVRGGRTSPLLGTPRQRGNASASSIKVKNDLSPGLSPSLTRPVVARRGGSAPVESESEDQDQTREQKVVKLDITSEARDEEDADADLQDGSGGDGDGDGGAVFGNDDAMLPPPGL